jgi:hypothetical protein
MRSAVEEMKADGVADAPIVEVTAPAVHLLGRHLPGFIDE